MEDNQLLELFEISKTFILKRESIKTDLRNKFRETLVKNTRRSLSYHNQVVKSLDLSAFKSEYFITQVVEHVQTVVSDIKNGIHETELTTFYAPDLKVLIVSEERKDLAANILFYMFSQLVDLSFENINVRRELCKMFDEVPGLMNLINSLSQTAFLDTVKGNTNVRSVILEITEENVFAVRELLGMWGCVIEPLSEHFISTSLIPEQIEVISQICTITVKNKAESRN